MSSDYELDALEGRVLLSATLSRRGILYVVGTHRNDTIQINLERGHRGFIEVRVNREVDRFKASAVKQIIVQGGRGNDRIVFNDRYGHVPGRHDIYGGAGNDYLVADGGSDEVFGGGPGEVDTITGGIDEDAPTPSPVATGGDSSTTQPSTNDASTGSEDFPSGGTGVESSGGDASTTQPSTNDTSSGSEDFPSGGTGVESSGGDFGDDAPASGADSSSTTTTDDDPTA